MSNLLSKELIKNISALLENARKKVAIAVNQAMVLTYFEIGRMIVEDEQNGENRAEYGKELLKDLSLHLTERFGRGFSVENLDRMRFFYKTYSEQNSSTVLTNSKNQISSTVSTELQNTEKQIVEKKQTLSDLFKISQTPPVNFNLSWSHYLKLMRIKDQNERKFYEIESFKNNWSFKQQSHEVA